MTGPLLDGHSEFLFFSASPSNSTLHQVDSNLAHGLRSMGFCPEFVCGFQQSSAVRCWCLVV